MAALPDALHPQRNPAGYLAGSAAVYALITMLVNVIGHHGAFSTPVFIAGMGAVASWYVRTKVTPVAAPRDNAGNALVPAPAVSTPPAVTVGTVIIPPSSATGTVTVLPSPGKETP